MAGSIEDCIILLTDQVVYVRCLAFHFNIAKPNICTLY